MKNTDQLYQYEEEFRNSIGTVDEKGKRIWVYPKKPAGFFHNKRVLVTIILLALFFSGPFIKINGQPFMLFNIFERKFIVFGQVFWPQDFVLLALTLITFFVFVILFTVVFGRVWCGWACPQTLFMEMVYRKIEYWIEGDANQQRKLKAAPWTKEKIIKKGGKQIIFVSIAILIAHTAMAYLIGLDQVIAIVQQPPAEHMAGFIGLVAFTGIFYFVFAWFREQACIVVCPYGRLQGVLLGKESIVVAYDWLRGEQRGKIKKNEPRLDKGDCIDCKLCVHVCPTGIDIRNGTQLECVNCTACIDVCDDVMVKIDKPKGLIRFASYNSIVNRVQQLWNPRVMGYSIVLTALLVLLSFMVFTRSPIETTLLKVPGTLFQKTDRGGVTNLYNIEFINKSFDDRELTIRVISPVETSLQLIGEPLIKLPAEQLVKRVIILELPAEAIKEAKTSIALEVSEKGEVIEVVKTKFIGPVSIKK
ncbi:cytochrome c oxidase accessory protein CcoG [Chryseotalea sanaruensis]|uniref:Cytochrome c oxidase accessory protein CcoG n=1 Tax=Chryseotalea sanaruensis TaxID=2482724 RepID=A0A401UEZ7_9BACT|nr:cytochrome c oxidase accessory protein CcoG [Chryseotalea sanaruensis]GCC53481.1 cytochrome c oxidase accessory protein CcoG [Chryseotalea sanaruensis]